LCIDPKQIKLSNGGLSMIRYYNVFERGKYVTVVKAMSEKDACKQVYMKRGSASRYTGNGMHDYTAEVVKL